MTSNTNLASLIEESPSKVLKRHSWRLIDFSKSIRLTNVEFKGFFPNRILQKWRWTVTLLLPRFGTASWRIPHVIGICGALPILRTFCGAGRVWWPVFHNVLIYWFSLVYGMFFQSSLLCLSQPLHQSTPSIVLCWPCSYSECSFLLSETHGRYCRSETSSVL